MRGARIALFGAAVAWFLSLTPLLAHHVSAMYDLQHITTVRGTVTAFELINPHSLIHINVKLKEGMPQNWVVETAPPIMLRRIGWDRDKIKSGDLITVEGFRAKDGSYTMSVKKIILANGQELNEHQD